MTADPAWTPAVVPVAEVHLDCDWPPACPPRVLRGAVLARMREALGDQLHSDWHGHLEGPDGGMPRPAPIAYRVTGDGPAVYAWGERAHEHARDLAAHLRALRLPGGDVIEVPGVSLDLRAESAGVSRSWHAYRLATPYYPSAVAWARRPREGDRWRAAWAGQALRRSILDVLATVDRADDPALPLTVQVYDYQDVGVEWRRPERGVREEVRGFTCEFATCARLPDGIGLGHHRAEGFGEARLVAALGRR